MQSASVPGWQGTFPPCGGPSLSAYNSTAGPKAQAWTSVLMTKPHALSALTSQADGRGTEREGRDLGNWFYI